MRGALTVALLLRIAAAAQPLREVSGIVLDSSGIPISWASVDHAANRGPSRTDWFGRFRLFTKASAIVIRKPGYQSLYLETEGLQNASLALKPAAAGASIPACLRANYCRSLNGGRLCFPLIVGIGMSRPFQDTDHIREAFFTNETGIDHGVGLNWDWGTPDTGDVWDSVQYSEKVYPAVNGLPQIIEARGKSGSGMSWRYLGLFGESASYRDADAKTAALFDQVLDGVCLLPPKK